MLLLSTSLFLSACDKDSGQRKRPAQQSPGSITHEHDNPQKNADGTPKSDSAKNADGKDPKNPSNPNDTANKNPNDPQSPKTDNLDPNGNNQQLTVNSNNNGNIPPVVPSGGFPSNPPHSGNFVPGGNSPTDPLSQSDSRSTPRNGNSPATTKFSEDKVLNADEAIDEISKNKTRKKELSNKSKSIEIELNGDDEEKDADDESIADEDEESENSTIKKLKENGTKDIYTFYSFLNEMNLIYLNSLIAVNDNNFLKKSKNIFSVLIEKIKNQKLVIIKNGKDIKFDDKKNCNNHKTLIDKVSENNEFYFKLYQLNCDYRNSKIEDIYPILELKKKNNDDTDYTEWVLTFNNENYKKILNLKYNRFEDLTTNDNPKCLIEMENSKTNKKIENLNCDGFFQSLFPNKSDTKVVFVNNFDFSYYKSDNPNIKASAQIFHKKSDDSSLNCIKINSNIESFSKSLNPSFKNGTQENCNDKSNATHSSTQNKNYKNTYPNRSIASESSSYQNHLATNEVEKKVKKKVNLKEKRNM